MLSQVADGVLVHRSEFLQTNGVVVGRAGVQDHEPTCLADDLSDPARGGGLLHARGWEWVADVHTGQVRRLAERTS